MSSKKILLVDDDRNILTVLKMRLEIMGFEVTACNNPMTALELFKKEKFNLVLTDQRMEGIEGIELLSRLKKLDPFLPVIIMTAFGKVDDAVVSMKRGAFSYLEKPVNPDELEEIIRKAVEIRELEERISLERELWGKVISQIGAGLLICDTEGRIVWANNSAATLLESDSDILQAKLPFEKIILEKVAINGASHTFEYYDPRSKRWFLVSATRRIDESNPSHQIAVLLLEISNLKEAQKAIIERERLAGVLEMAGAVAHEFSQPMQAILLSAELLKTNKTESETSQRVIRRLESQIEALGALVHRLSDITKYARKKYPGTSGIVDLKKAAAG